MSTQTKDPPEGEYPDERPKFRSECHQMPRPCPFVSCKFHLYLEVRPRTGKIRINPLVEGISDIEEALRALPETCALDAIEKNGPMTLDIIGNMIGITRERVRQIEGKTYDQIRPRINPQDIL